MAAGCNKAKERPTALSTNDLQAAEMVEMDARYALKCPPPADQPVAPTFFLTVVAVIGVRVAVIGGRVRPVGDDAAVSNDLLTRRNSAVRISAETRLRHATRRRDEAAAHGRGGRGTGRPAQRRKVAAADRGTRNQAGQPWLWCRFTALPGAVSAKCSTLGREVI